MNFGIDPNLDPELALALRVSLEEERARQEQAQAATGGGTASNEPASTGALSPIAWAVGICTSTVRCRMGVDTLSNCAPCLSKKALVMASVSMNHHAVM